MRVHSTLNLSRFQLSSRHNFRLSLSTTTRLCSTDSSPSDHRPPRPLLRNQSINSGFSLDSHHHYNQQENNNSDQEVDPETNADDKRRRNLSHSLVGENVHASYSAKKEKDRWRKRPLFSRAGYEASFQTGRDAAELLVHEATRRDPNQVVFLQAVSSCAYDLSAAFERTPKLAWIFKQMMEPEEFSTFRVDWKDDNHNTRVNRGYFVLYSSALSHHSDAKNQSKLKGGISMCSVERKIFNFAANPEKTDNHMGDDGKEEKSSYESVDYVYTDRRMGHGVVRMCGWEQTLRNSLCAKRDSKENFFVGYGGHQVGTDFDPHEKSDSEVKRFCEAFMAKLMVLLPKDAETTFELDLNVGKKEMTFLKNAYSRLTGLSSDDTADFSQSDTFGSSLLFPEVRGIGCAYFADFAVEHHLSAKLSSKKILVSGAGNLSRNTCLKLIHLGAKPLTLSDDSGVLFCPTGLTFDHIKLVEHFKVNNAWLNSIPKHNLRGATFLPNKKVFDLPLLKNDDIEIGSYILFESDSCGERMGRAEVEKLVKGKCEAVFECMDGVCGVASEEIIRRNILYAPAKAVNAGAVVASMFLEENKDKVISLEDLDEHLKLRMKDIHDEISDIAEKYNLTGNLKAGANLLSFLRIAEKELLLSKN